MTTLITIPQDAVIALNGDVRTTSIKIAEAFGKQHHHLCQKINKLDCSAEFLTRNFSRVPFDHNGNQYDSYQITKDGFMFLVMGFTGKKAAAIKEAYIGAFNTMAAQLKRQTQPNTVPCLNPFDRCRMLFTWENGAIVSAKPLHDHQFVSSRDELAALVKEAGFLSLPQLIELSASVNTRISGFARAAERKLRQI